MTNHSQQAEEHAYLRVLVRDNPPGKVVGLSAGAIGRLLSKIDEQSQEVQALRHKVVTLTIGGDIVDAARDVVDDMHQFSLPAGPKVKLQHLENVVNCHERRR